MSLDFVLAFSKALADIDMFLKVPSGFHAEDSKGSIVSKEYYLKLRKNYYGSKNAITNYFPKFSNFPQEIKFKKRCY